ncbi:MAG: coproporphyrinogen dehydrogenase HemZ [Clostridia bacterium]
MGQRLPWGILTGVRPSKIPYDFMESGMTQTEASTCLMKEYLVQREKAELAAAVASKERILLADHDDMDVSLYVGIPFCPSRCAYCSFVSYDFHSYGTVLPAYVEALLQEMQRTAALLEGRRLQSFYMGGGTPTVLDAGSLDRILERADALYSFSALREITVEAGRPDTITREKLRVLADHGVDRISINPQTMNQKTLDAVGRRHSVEQAEVALETAREIGFDNINSGFNSWAAGETQEDVRRTMERIVRLKPDSLTIHTLAIKRASRLHEEEEAAADLLAQADRMESMLRESAAAAAALGMQPYYMYRQKNMAGNFENVGYCLPGKECLYNVEIMEERQTIFALGAGAVTKVYYPEQNRLERVPNVKNVEHYISRIQEMIDRKWKGVPKL